MTELVEIPAALATERVDRVVALLTGRTRSEVAVAIVAGRVKLGGRVVSERSDRVKEGQVLEIDLEPKGARPSFIPENATAIDFSVVFEDDSLIVVDKPAGVVVHPGAGHRDDTLIAALVSRYPDLSAISTRTPDRPGIVHRLDKETSGLLVIARDENSFDVLSNQLRDHTMGRMYLALVLGLVSSDTGVVDAPIGRSRRDRLRMAVSAGGREARTHYEVSARYRHPVDATLLRVTLETGRTHQIRVHLSAIGHPVAGDRRYGGASALGLTRPFLHAATLTLTHPRTGERLTFDAPLPEDLVAELAHLSKDLSSNPRSDAP